MEEPGIFKEQDIIDAYNARAIQYADKDAVLDAGAGYRVNAYYDYISKRWILKYLVPSALDTVLEFGCGMGRVTRLLAPYVRHITGVDVSVELLKLAQQVPLANADYYLLENGLSVVPPSTFNKVLFNWVLIHINDHALHAYLEQLDAFITPHTQCYVFEQCNPYTRTQPTPIHIHRTREEYIQIFKQHGWACTKTTRAWRIPSYGLSYWNKYARLPEIVLPMLALLDDKTLYRKPRFIEYTTEVFIFRKDNA